MLALQNTNAGLISPFEHGEVYVLNDGGEADLDLGNYERFLDISVSKEHDVTTGYVSTSIDRAVLPNTNRTPSPADIFQVI